MPDDWAISLVSGLLGALVGALATLRAARWQLGQIARNHEEALQHQNDLLKQAFQNQLELQLAEHRLAAQLQLLRRLYEFFADTAFPVYGTGHALRNNWKQQLIHEGKTQFSEAAAAFRDQASDATRAFARILEENKHHQEIHDRFYATLSFQAQFFEPIQIMLNSIAKLPDRPNREMVSLIEEQGQNFLRAVSTYGEWVTQGKDMATAMQSELLTVRRS
jgi:hypothetical protein